jgi:hypothetical protein
MSDLEIEVSIPSLVLAPEHLDVSNNFGGYQTAAQLQAALLVSMIPRWWLSPLRNLLELERLSIVYLTFVDLCFTLSNMMKLGTLEIMNTGVCSLSPLRGLCKLKKLDIKLPVTPPELLFRST